MKVYTTQDHSTPTYTRNSSCWAADLAQSLTCFSPWNTTGSFQRAGVAITPRHVLFATHYPPSQGDTIRFVTTSNAVVTRTISSLQALPTTGSYYPDITIGVLDSDLPGTISIAKVLPASARAKLPDLTQHPLPCFMTDQEEKLCVRNWIVWPHDKSAEPAVCGFAQPSSSDVDDARRLSFYENAISGDSGSPACVFINGDVVVLCALTSGGPGIGTSLTAFWNDIEAITQANGHNLTAPDLTGFPDL